MYLEERKKLEIKIKNNGEKTKNGKEKNKKERI